MQLSLLLLLLLGEEYVYCFRAVPYLEGGKISVQVKTFQERLPAFGISESTYGT